MKRGRGVLGLDRAFLEAVELVSSAVSTKTPVAAVSRYAGLATTHRNGFILGTCGEYD